MAAVPDLIFAALGIACHRHKGKISVPLINSALGKYCLVAAIGRVTRYSPGKAGEPAAHR